MSATKPDFYHPRKCKVIDIAGRMMFVCDEKFRFHQFPRADGIELGASGTLRWEHKRWVFSEDKQ